MEMDVFVVLMSILSGGCLSFIICRLYFVFKSSNSGYASEGVSVIMTVNNASEALVRNLPTLLAQKHSDYEVIVVNENSDEKTAEILSELKKSYPHLKTTEISPDAKFRSTKKISMNIGILAAKNDLLLFTTPEARPVSEYWVARMASYLEKAEAVIGYSNYGAEYGELRWKRYFRLRRFLSLRNRMAIAYMGNIQNMGFRK